MPETDAFVVLSSLLRDFGLTAPSLTRWLREQVTLAVSEDQIMLELQQRPEYKQRFPAMEARRKAGLPPITESEYIALEGQYTAIMRNAGMPPGFYDQQDDFTSFISQDMSPQELESRVLKGVVAAQQAPEEVKTALQDFYGIQNTTGALAAYYLDPDRALPEIEKQFAAAQVAGAGRGQGFDISQGKAEQLAAQGIGYAQANQGFSAVAANQNLFREQVGERADLDAVEEGVDAFVGQDGQAQELLRQRAARREAAFGGTGGAVGNQQGGTNAGFGTAR